MATLEEIIQQSLLRDKEKMTFGASGYYADQTGEGETSLGNNEYSQAMQYRNMVDNMINAQPQILQYNDIPLDQGPFQEYGGRISTGIPLGEQQRLQLGLSAQGFNDPYFSQPLRPTGIDASYQSGNTGFGVSYEQLSPDQKKLLFSIFREF